MAMFAFESITPEQARNLQAADVVTFAGGPARLASVAYNPTGTITITLGERAVEFGGSLPAVSAAGGLRFTDGSRLLVGGAAGDALRDGPGDDALFGGDGADLIIAEAGANFVQGNKGNDRIFTDLGADTVHGGQGDDMILAGLFSPQDAGNFVHGNLGNDTIAGGGGRDTLLGGQGNDLISGSEGVVDTLNGNLGDDSLIANGGAAVLLGEDGNDHLEARGPDAFLLGGAGADEFQIDVPDLGAAPVRVRTTIFDWSTEDHLIFAGVRADHTYAEAAAQDLAQATATANALLRANARPGEAGNGIVAVALGDDVLLYVNNLGDADADFFVVLAGRTLADIADDDII